MEAEYFFEALVAFYQDVPRGHPRRRQFTDVCFVVSLFASIPIFSLLSITDYLFFCLPSLPRFLLIFFFVPFVGAFEKLRKATVSFVVSVCRSVCLSLYLSVRPVRTEQLGSQWVDFHEICICSEICRENSSLIER